MAVAREIVLRQLTTRARSRAELQKALDARGVPAEASEEVLDRFEELRLVDDAAFSQAWAENRQRSGRSTRVIRQELRTKGVDSDTVLEAMGSLDEDADLQSALAFARKRVSALRNVEPAVRYRRLAGALARRGFPSGVVARVLREVLNPSEPE
ncbi:regulatory protein RecX [Propioniciclava tarda]|uniref:regulatory protein RecX n=1 Tax=Propioniciclava tarda TaxID=433330 RepID=UPI0013F1430B|nr:regulatory protein RecX [Propioniciclava tarda]HOA88036.1 regulatory protein RecX [Propioniciclava tarda]HQA30524.1 regulatory protein RecX [Propioniciclava tarda]HQD59690.1 regulatory protein RecX [Propioniciclava tarda]